MKEIISLLTVMFSVGLFAMPMVMALVYSMQGSNSKLV